MTVLRRLRKELTGLTGAQRTRLRLLAVVATLVGLVPFLLSWRLEALLSRTLLETDESRYYLPAEDWLVPLSLGYREAFAGILWVRTLVYFGEQHEVRGNFENLEPYLLGITALDPYFYRVYTWGNMSALYNGTTINRGDVEMSIRILERGLRYFPNDGDLHYYLGFQYHFELAQFVGDEEMERVQRIGIDEICTGAMLGGGPPYLPLSCSSLEERAGMDQIAQERLLQALVETDDELTRSRIEERLEQTLSPDAVFRILQRIDDVRLRWRQEMPYVPMGFYVVAGPRPPVPLADEATLPLPMDDMIRAEEEELLYSGEAESEPAEGEAAAPAQAGQ